MSEETVLKEIVVDHYFYIMEGVFERGSFPHIYSKNGNKYLICENAIRMS